LLLAIMAWFSARLAGIVLRNGVREQALTVTLLSAAWRIAQIPLKNLCESAGNKHIEVDPKNWTVE
jgi:hypothetical protein